MARNPEHLHALVFPYPTQGHITPMMQFAKKLASKGVIVTFLTTHHRHQQITKAHTLSAEQDDPIEQEARKLGLDISSAQISDGLPLDFDRSARFNDFMRSVDNMGGELEQLLHNLNKTGPAVSCVIADTILPWSFEIAKKLGIPWISFWTQPTVLYSIYYHAHLLEDLHHSLCEGTADEGSISIDYIPGVPTLKTRDLPSFIREGDADSKYILNVLRKSFQLSREADWVLGNSFDDLESKSVHLKPPVLQVGPLLPSSFLNSEHSKDIGVGTSIWTQYDASEWLDAKPNGSVIYVSFGSLIHATKAQLEEIAMGLKDSGQFFLWVLRPDIVSSTVSDCLPDGFLDEIKMQGLVVPWCNQLQVLSHPSVAGFITHCGWNSMLESIALAVPMIGFPFWADQFTNCKLMADEWKIGYRFSGGGQAGDKGLIVRKDISSAIRQLFSEEGTEVKKNVEGLRDSARAAVREGGSSDKNIERFVEGLKGRGISK
uniref:Glycosyltransferase n=1 Tax=Picea sitchensis TaxID=3332 RepID=C0PPT9_PICSI|nr:unknown [Picea sitchensis]